MGLRNEVNWLLVKSVSRSFYLTLRLLPRAVRSEITLAYLLARASDTIADTSRTAISIRLEALKALQEFVQGRAKELDVCLGQGLAPFQNHLAERQLLEELPVLLKKLGNDSNNKEIREVWSTILEGQIFDLEHSFSPPLSAEQLDLYTFQVAGCVGKFWTQLCFRKIPNFSFYSFPHMEELGVCYGKGLQLINILRDRKEDALRGRVYLQQEGVEKYRQQAFKAMEAGVQYAMAVRDPILRYGVLLPALMGISTLKIIGPYSENVKISRREVYRILVSALPCLWNKRYCSPRMRQ